MKTDPLIDKRGLPPVSLSNPAGNGFTLKDDGHGNALVTGTFNPGRPDCEVTVTLTVGGNPVPQLSLTYTTNTTWQAVFDMTGIDTTTDAVVEVTNSCAGGPVSASSLVWVRGGGGIEPRLPQLAITHPANTIEHPYPHVHRLFHISGTVTPGAGYRLSVDVMTPYLIPLYGVVVPPIDLTAGHWSAVVTAFEHGDNYSARAYLADASGDVLAQVSCGPFRINNV
jgi:hypothetical protein